MNAPPRAPLSAVLITRNAAAVLDSCLESLAFASEILIVDSASSDGTLEGDLLHDSSDDLAAYLDRQNRYTTLAARQAYELGRSSGVLRLLFSPVVRFFKFYILRLGFLDGVPGLLHISIGCMNSYLKYAKLLELRKADGR